MELNVLISIILEALSFSIFVYSSIRASIEDIRTLSVPRNLSISCLILILILQSATLYAIYYDVYSPSFLVSKVTEPLRGAFIAFFIFEAVRLITNKQLGFADVLFAAIGGAAIGAIWWLSGAFLACIGGLIHFFAQKEEKPLPFIPFICSGTAFMWILKIIWFVSKSF